jgi:hypothetical protein
MDADDDFEEKEPKAFPNHSTPYQEDFAKGFILLVLQLLLFSSSLPLFQRMIEDCRCCCDGEGETEKAKAVSMKRTASATATRGVIRNKPVAVRDIVLASSCLLWNG